MENVAKDIVAMQRQFVMQRYERRASNAESPNVGTRYYWTLDLVRFSSAILVIFFHLCYINSDNEFRLILPMTWLGWVGVEVFFVISGAVIANSANGSTATNFLKSRILRLYPSAWICATLTFIVLLFSGESHLFLSYARSLALLPLGPWISDVYWTIAVEISFYFLIFNVLLFRKFEYIGWVAMLLSCLSFVYMTLVTFKCVNEKYIPNILLFRHGCLFALGIWIWLSTTRRLRFPEFFGVLIAVLSSIAEIRLTGLKFLPRETLGEINIVAPIFVWGLLVFMIVLGMSKSISVPARYSELFRTLGLITYPLYLSHDIFGQRLIQHLLILGVQKWTALIVGISSVIFLSLIIVKLEVRIRYGLAFMLNWIEANLVTKIVTERY